MTAALRDFLLTFERKIVLLALLIATALVAISDVFTVMLIFPILFIVLRSANTSIPIPFDGFPTALSEPGNLYILGIALIAVVLVKNVAMAGTFYWQTKIARNIAMSVSLRVLRGYLAAPIEFHMGRTTADYTRGLRDLPSDVAFQGGLAYCNRIAEVAGTVMLGLALGYLEPLGMTLALVILGLFVLANHRYIGPRLRHWSTKGAAHTRALYRVIAEVFPNMKVVRTSAAEDLIDERISNDLRENLNVQRKNRYANLVMRPLAETVMIFSGVALVVVVMATRNSAIEALPFLATFTYAIFRMLPATTRIANYNNELRRIQPLLEELVAELQATEPYLENTSHRGAQIQFNETLELRNVGYRYPGTDNWAVRGIDLKIRKGEVVGLSGRSGSGKSTLADLMLGLMDPTEGEILVDGRPPIRDGISPGSVGYVPQDNPLLEMSARENVAFGRRPDEIDEQRVLDAVKAAQLGQTIEALPGGLDAVVGGGGTGLSGGQRQRFGIARALYGHPSLLVLDEATSNLDAETEFEVSKAVERLRGQTTIVMIAHRMHLLKSCDRVNYFENGRIHAAGSYDEVFEMASEFRNLVEITDRYGKG